MVKSCETCVRNRQEILLQISAVILSVLIGVLFFASVFEIKLLPGMLQAFLLIYGGAFTLWWIVITFDLSTNKYDQLSTGRQRAAEQNYPCYCPKVRL